ncbi:MAG TPA: RNA polymerase sigma factor [Conexibacter sp.]|nr:RNA polymerase sigma factor [Conexibacter sp.]
MAAPLLRLRSDEQLVRLFRAGSDEAFRVIHDRYRTRLFAYARQMLGGSRADAEDALQDVFVRAHAALRANDRDVSLRAWLYRIAHNRCVDELRRVGAIGLSSAPAEVLELVHAPAADPMDVVERRESLRRLVEDVQRLPDQQRSALLMREISGMAYSDLAVALEVTVPAVKSLLVRARIGLAQAAEARDTACAAIRADLADAHERGVRASGLVRRHLHDCSACSTYRKELRTLDARLAALVPALGPAALVAKLLGAVVGGGGGSSVAGGSAGGAAAAGGAGAAAAGAGAAATAGAGAAGIGAAHIAAAVAVAVVSAGGAVEMHQSLAAPQHRHPAAPIERVVAMSPSPAAWAAADAQQQLAAALRLKLPIVPATGASGSPVLAPLPLDAAGPITGGASAPSDPPVSATDPATPPPDGGTTDASGNGTSGSVPVVGASSGSSSPPPPAPSDPSAPATSSSGDPASPTPPAPPATSADPSQTTTSTSGPPPSSATTGGATYPR